MGWICWRISLPGIEQNVVMLWIEHGMGHLWPISMHLMLLAWPHWKSSIPYCRCLMPLCSKCSMGCLSDSALLLPRPGMAALGLWLRCPRQSNSSRFCIDTTQMTDAREGGAM